MLESTKLFLTLLLTAALVGAPAVVEAQEDEDPEHVEEVKLQRRGAGLRIGVWNLSDDADPAESEIDAWPYLEGYFQRGLDRHLAIESTLGLQQRSIKTTTDGGVIGGSSTREETIYVVPLLTAIKLYPFTGPENVFEPFIAAGGGFAFGVEDVESSGGLTGGGGTNVQTGFGVKGEAGAEWRFSTAFGLAARVGYQWIRFGDELGTTDTYKGWNVAAGLTYRFQY